MTSFNFLKLLLVLAVFTASVNGWWSKKKKVSGGTIASTADKYVGSTKWSFASSHTVGTNTDKCNIFVADVLKEAGADVPQRHWLTWSPIGAGEWKNPNSSYLASNKCYKLVTSPQNGDIIAGQGHVGIVTGHRTTTSAGSDKILKNDWGYRSNNHGIIYWRYVC